jgi:hypothetical protein
MQYSGPHATDLAHLQMIRNLQRQAIMYRFYFQALNPVMTSGNTGATYVDQEDDLYAKIDEFQDSRNSLRGHLTHNLSTGLGPTTTLNFEAFGRESTVALDALHHQNSCCCCCCFPLFRHKRRVKINSAATSIADTPYESRLASHVSENSQHHSSGSEIQANAKHSSESEIIASVYTTPAQPVRLVNQVLRSVPTKEEVKTTLHLVPFFLYNQPLL